MADGLLQPPEPDDSDGGARRSLKRHFFWLLTGVVGLFLLGMALSVLFSLHTSRAAEEHVLDVEAVQAHSSVMRRWNYYREVLLMQTRDAEVIDILRTDADEAAQRWVAARQAVLPHVQGLVLLNARDEPLASAGWVGAHPGCLEARSEIDGPGPLRAHRRSPADVHIDMAMPVHDGDGAPLGWVVLSTEITQFHRAIEDATQPGHYIALRDAEGRVLASSGSVKGKVYQVRMPLKPLGWQLEVLAPQQRLSLEGRLQILAGTLTLVGVLVFLVLAVTRLRQPIMNDIGAVLEALACLTRNESAPPIKTRYVEFASITDDINRIAQQLHAQRKQLAALSMTDTLTGLPNRRAFDTRFPQMMGLAERGHKVTLIALDLDHFKAINDRLGHAAGDKALIALANTFNNLTRTADSAFRVAGDEFAVLMCGLDDEGIKAWYRRLSAQFENELRLTGMHLDNTISAGQTWLCQTPGDTLEHALARADAALYEAKARGRGQLVLAEDLPPQAAG